MIDRMIDKIKNELRRRLEASEDGMIEIKMRKSGDVVIITASRAAADPLCIFQIKSFKLQAVYALGYYELAKEIADYDQTVEKQQNLILDLYTFESEKLETGTASESEIAWYIDAYHGLFGYKTDIAA